MLVSTWFMLAHTPGHLASIPPSLCPAKGWMVVEHTDRLLLGTVGVFQRTFLTMTAWNGLYHMAVINITTNITTTVTTCRLCQPALHQWVLVQDRIMADIVPVQGRIQTQVLVIPPPSLICV